MLEAIYINFIFVDVCRKISNYVIQFRFSNFPHEKHDKFTQRAMGIQWTGTNYINLN